MNAEIEVLPVTPNETLRILGSLNMKELEHILDKIRLLRNITKASRDDDMTHRVMVKITPR